MVKRGLGSPCDERARCLGRCLFDEMRVGVYLVLRIIFGSEVGDLAHVHCENGDGVALFVDVGAGSDAAADLDGSPLVNCDASSALSHQAQSK